MCTPLHILRILGFVRKSVNVAFSRDSHLCAVRLERPRADTPRRAQSITPLIIKTTTTSEINLYCQYIIP